MRLGVIYKVTCTDNGNFIIGSSLTPNKRKNQYLSKLRKNKWANPYLQNCFNKYGENSLIFEILRKDIPENILEAIENIYIGVNCAKVDDRKGGMNLQDGTRVNWSKESKLKASNSAKKRLKLGHPFTGKHHSEETKQKIREATLKQFKEKGHPKGMLGKKQSKKSIEKRENTKKANREAKKK